MQELSSEARAPEHFVSELFTLRVTYGDYKHTYTYDTWIDEYQVEADSGTKEAQWV